MNQTDALEEKRSYVIRELKRNGCRITNQRQILIDVILQDECCCCKEMYYQALEKDPTIGMATVYRMVKTLEEIGLIQEKESLPDRGRQRITRPGFRAGMKGPGTVLSGITGTGSVTPMQKDA